MEFCFEFVFTISVSLIFSFFIAKLLSLLSTNDHVFLKTVNSPKFEADTTNFDWVKIGYVSEIVEVDVIGESKQGGELTPEELLLDESCGSQKRVEDSITRDNEAVDLEEKSIIQEEKSTTQEKCSEEDGGVVCDCEESCNLVDESSKTVNQVEIEGSKARSDSEEIKIVECEVGGDEFDGVKEEGLLEGEDDWEGIERSELERLFDAAVAYVGSKCNAERISIFGSDLNLQLYGLQMVATEGPCHVPQPMALKVSARAKWNAWKQLGDMNPDAAMDQYVNLLSRTIPGWMKDGLGEDGKQDLNITVGNRQDLLDDEGNLPESMPDIEGLHEDK